MADKDLDKVARCLEPESIEGEESEPESIECAGEEWANKTAMGLAQFIAGPDATDSEVKETAKRIRGRITAEDIEEWERSTWKGLAEFVGAGAETTGELEEAKRKARDLVD